MLEIDGIDVHYGPVQALFGVSLRVDEGEMVALLGANGAGKTTTLRTISGLLSPTRGAVRIKGNDVAGVSPQRVVRMGVAQLPEGRELFPELTVLENLRLGYWSRRKDKAGFTGKIEHVFHLFPRLKERSTQAAGTLSGGEQQMLAVGRALMSSPKLLLVDEVSLGLAPIVVADLFAALEEVNREGTAILLVEQFVHLALKHTSRAYVLAKGEVVIEGKSKSLLASPELMAAYLGEMEDEAAPKAAAPPEVIEIDVTEPEALEPAMLEPEVIDLKPEMSEPQGIETVALEPVALEPEPAPDPVPAKPKRARSSATTSKPRAPRRQPAPAAQSEPKATAQPAPKAAPKAARKATPKPAAKRTPKTRAKSSGATTALAEAPSAPIADESPAEGGEG